MAPLRARRERFKRFTYGRQWDDAVRDPDTGRTMTERQLLSRDGRPPLTNNLIRQLVKSIVGRYRVEQRRDLSSDGIHDAGHSTHFIDDNPRPETAVPDYIESDCRLLEEFLISGVAVQRVGADTYSRAKGLPLVENIATWRFFVNTHSDPQGTDIDTIGALHDITPEEVVMRWGGGRRGQAMAMLRQLTSEPYTSGFPIFSSPEFGVAEGGRVRVVEVWHREPFESYAVIDPEGGNRYNVAIGEVEKLRAENRRRSREGKPPLAWRWQLTRRWVGRWYLPDGTLLDTVKLGAGQSHPFVAKLYPLIDGEVHSLVEDVVDQQKYVNRLINLLDRMMATAAKGALLFPVDALPEGCEFADIARQWSATDGVVLYKSYPGDQPPQQITTQVGDIGARDLLKVEMELFKEISGVGDTLAGRSVPANVGAERYNLEIQNAAVSVLDLLETFRSLIRARNKLLMDGLKDAELPDEE